MFELINRIYNLDCIEGMKELPNECVDLVITDPPFAIDFQSKKANYHRTQSRVIEGYQDIDKRNYLDFSMAWMQQAYRLLKSSGSMYVFSGWNNLKDVLIALDNNKFRTINHIIWKYQFGVVTKKKFVTSHYHLLYVCKNEKERKFNSFARFGQKERDKRGSLHYRDKEDVWGIAREYWNGSQKTPTKLPSELVKKILQYSSNEGDVVLDPFLGSGQVAVVSKMLKRKYVGFEIAKKYFDFAQKRLSENSYRIKA